MIRTKEDKHYIEQLKKLLGVYSLEEQESINELKKVFLVSENVDEIIKEADSDSSDLEELKNLFSCNNEVLSNDDEVNIVVSDKKDSGGTNFELNYLGVFNNPPQPKKYCLYRNSNQGIVYFCQDNKWIEFLVDGKSDSVYVGGGLGERDVIQLIEEHGGSGDFTGTLDATKVNVDETYLVATKGATAQELFESIDKTITSKILFGEYKTMNMDEVGNTIHVGCMDVDGGWYIKKVVTDSDGDIVLTYTNNYASGTSYDYENAYNNKYSLNYVSVSELGLG